jgi:AcrR family transcriptional regulator
MINNRKSEKILNTTIRLFLRSGAKKVSMDDIAENAGISKVTIYKYFSDKDTLYLEISRHIFSGYAKRLESISGSGRAFIEKLYDFIDMICDFTDSGQLDLCGELSRYHHEIDAEFDVYRQTYRSTLLGLIDGGIRSGLLKNGLDGDSIYYYIDMGFLYYQQNPEYRNRMHSDEAFRKKFMLFFVGNIFADANKILSV